MSDEENEEIDSILRNLCNDHGEETSEIERLLENTVNSNNQNSAELIFERALEDTYAEYSSNKKQKFEKTQ